MIDVSEHKFFRSTLKSSLKPFSLIACEHQCLSLLFSFGSCRIISLHWLDENKLSIASSTRFFFL